MDDDIRSKKYAFNLQKCVSCGSIVIIAATRSERAGSVDLTSCPTVDNDYMVCAGKMVPVQTGPVVIEVVGELNDAN